MSDDKGMREQLIDSLKERFSSPYLAFFTTAWIFHNWKLLVALVTLDQSFYERIGHLQQFFNVWDLLWWPLLKAAGIFILYIIISLIAHAIYAWFKYGIGQIDEWVNKTNYHTQERAVVYETALIAFSSSEFLKKHFKNGVQGNDAKAISEWNRDFHLFKSQIQGNISGLFEQLDPQKPLIGTNDYQKQKFLDFDLVEKDPDDNYVFTTKGRYFYCQITGTSPAAAFPDIAYGKEGIFKRKQQQP